MELKSLKLKNFAQFTDFEILFEDRITKLVGVNGSGKTTIGLTAIWACLRGIAEKNNNDNLIGERFRFIGNKKASSDIEIKVFDESTKEIVTIKNHITKQSNYITCEPVRDQNWLNDLMHVAFISAKNFTSYSPKEQALLLGIKTDEYDEKIKNAKQDLSYYNKMLKQSEFTDIIEVDKVEKVNAEALLAYRKQIEKDYESKKNDIDKHNRTANQRKYMIETTLSSLKEYQSKINDIEKWLKDNPNIDTKEEIEKPNYDEIDKDIRNAIETNRKADEYEEYQKSLKKKNNIEDEINKIKENINKLNDERLRHIKSFNFGFDGLEIDDNGGLLLNNRPIKEPYYSKGELEIIVAKMAVSLNPKLKLRFIDDFELLDEDNQTKIIDYLIKSDFQIITAEVAKGAVYKSDILLRECRKVEWCENEKEKLI